MKARATSLALVMAIGVSAACSEALELPESPDATSPTPEASLPDAGPDDVVDARPVYDGANMPVTCDAHPCVVRVVAGISHYCAQLDDGTVRCWGRPDVLGSTLDGGAHAGASPVKVEGVSDVASLTAHGNRTCAVVTDGTVVCWGDSEPTATRLADVADAKHVVLGYEMSCAIVGGGALRCWGDSGIFGSGMRDVDLEGRSARGGAISNWAAFALDSEGDLRSWGADRLLLARESSVGIDSVARPVNGLPKVAEIASSSAHACAITTDGRLFCWGAAGNAMLGVGYVRDEPYPIAVSLPDLVWPQQVSVSDTHSCVRMTSGAVSCWGGLNPWGELGILKRGGVYAPTRVEGLPEHVVSVATSLASSCALTKSGVVWCWGQNSSGQLGRGQRDDDRHPAPAPVIFP